MKNLWNELATTLSGIARLMRSAQKMIELSLFVPWVLLIVHGVDIFDPIVNTYETHREEIHSSTVEKLCNMMKSDALNLLITLHIYFIAHMLSNILAAYGALKVRLYGDDPFNPLVPLSSDRALSVSNRSARFALSPNKKWTVATQTTLKVPVTKNKPLIISVLPADFKANQYTNVINNRMNWSKFKPIQPPGLISMKGRNQQQESRSNYNVNYNYWQWSELAPQSLSNANKRNVSYFNYKQEKVRDDFRYRNF
uniref:Uncharacterized protein n=1 Tax=Glossina brevipalpis TaxID=37001 RepID=A0A1A9X058_9MUSC